MPANLKPYHGRSFKRLRRIEIAARLEARFIPDITIANHLGITVQALNAIKNTPEYLARRTQLDSGVLSVYDQAQLASEEARKAALDNMIPQALSAVNDILHDRTHPHHAKVALDLLDRTRATSKISRTEHSVELKPDTSVEDKRAKNLLGILNAQTVQEAKGSSDFDDFRTPNNAVVKTEDRFGALDSTASRTLPHTPKSYQPDVEADDTDITVAEAIN